MSGIPRLDRADAKALAKRIVKNEVYVAWSPEQLDYSFGMFLTIAVGSDALSTEDLREVGMVWEEWSKANERGVNGYPTFFSAHLVTWPDRIKVQRECVRLSMALGDLPADALAKFDAEVKELVDARFPEEGVLDDD